MKHVTAVLGPDLDTRVIEAAAAIARLLRVDTRRLMVPESGERTIALDAVLDALERDDVVAGVLGSEAPHGLCWDVACRVTRPLLVVPRNCDRTPRDIARVLLPLDGTPETAASVADVAQRAIDAGAAVLGMHVFDPATVPAFWDQAAHAGRDWTQEFIRRNLPPGVSLDLRQGRTPEELLREAASTGVDLIVIGWKQDVSSGRAPTVRRALTDGTVPVLLVAAERGPS